MPERLDTLLIERNTEIPKSSVGDFCVLVKPEDKRLLVPDDVNRLLQAINVSDAESFVAYVFNYPTYFAEGLKWTQEQVRQAKIKLVARLVGYVPDSTLFPEPHKKPAYSVEKH